MTRSALVTPLDAQFTAHRDAEKRRRETVEWLAERERELGFVSDVTVGNNEQLFLPGMGPQPAPRSLWGE